MENESDWLDKLNSTSESVRRLALVPLFNQMSGPLHAYFLKRLESGELAADSVQETFERLFNRLERPLNEAKSKAKIRGYIWRTATNVRNEMFKEINSPTVSLEETTPRDSKYLRDEGVEETLNNRWSPKKWLNLVQHLPHIADRFIMALRLYGLSVRQISGLTSWSKDKILRRVKATQTILEYQFPRSPEYLEVPSKQAQLLSFTNDLGHEGMTFANARLDLEYLSSETSRMLCKDLGIKNIQQLPLLFAPVLVILNAYSEHSILRLSFSPRDDFDHSVFRGAPVPYLDTNLTFRREKISGNGVQEKLWLDDTHEFKAWIDDYPKTQGGVRVASWYYALPEPVVITKEEKESLQFLDERIATKPVLLPFWARLATQK